MEKAATEYFKTLLDQPFHDASLSTAFPFTISTLVVSDQMHPRQDRRLKGIAIGKEIYMYEFPTQLNHLLLTLEPSECV